MKISGIASAFPENYYTQQQILDELAGYWSGETDRMKALNRFHHRVGVDGRYLALPIDQYAPIRSWGEANRRWLEVAEDLGGRAIMAALDSAGMDKEALGAIIAVSVTGIASPSLDAHLVNTLELPRGIRRIPIFGLGCVAGAAGLAQAAEYVRAYPDRTAVLLSVELCSLTWQRNDLSVANLIASGLFGDGAAAVVVTGDDVPGYGLGNGSGNGRGNGASKTPDLSLENLSAQNGAPDNGAAQNGTAKNGTAKNGAPKFRAPQILGSQSSFYPDTEEVMGWDISECGFKIVLSPDVPEVIQANLPGDMDRFLAQHDLCRCDIGSWVLHTGGPKVLQATAKALGLKEDACEASWECLRRVGNLSSTSVLLVLEDIMLNHTPAPGTYGVLAAMGPGFCSELVLLRW
jgi:alkylresorcinol/alkylpyrone synthase